MGNSTKIKFLFLHRVLLKKKKQKQRSAPQTDKLFGGIITGYTQHDMQQLIWINPENMKTLIEARATYRCQHCPLFLFFFFSYFKAGALTPVYVLFVFIQNHFPFFAGVIIHKASKESNYENKRKIEIRSANLQKTMICSQPQWKSLRSLKNKH